MAAQPPWLHGEVARRMAERLPLMRQAPQVMLDWEAVSGASEALLKKAYPQARYVAVDSVARGPVVTTRAPWWSALGSALRRRPVPSIDADALPAGGAQLLWSNMALHRVADPPALFVRWREALAVDGFVMFSTLGPDTLRSLRELYREAGWGAAHAPFVDMHDLGDMMVHAGLADPVMDQELLRLTWPDPAALLGELRTLGVNADPARCAGLRTPRWRRRLEAALAERAGNDGRIALEFEVVYGHAFNPPPRMPVAGETRVSAEQLQRMARSGRRGKSLG